MQAAVTIYDLLGKVVYDTKRELNAGQNVLQLDANELGQGMYVCAISTAEYGMVKKIFIR